jgi:hypothetical protein
MAEGRDRAACHPPWAHRQRGRCALQGVETRHFGGGHAQFAYCVPGGSLPGQAGHLGHFLSGRLVWRPIEPVAAAVRFEAT